MKVPNGYSEKSSSGLNRHDLSVHRGFPFPNHMVLPEQDGYRTPTIEDYEQHNSSSTRARHRHAGSSTDNHFHLPITLPPSAMFTKRNISLSNLNPAPRILEKLEWRERIRHFTWTFFTMTMATGGIANVIHSGENTGRNSYVLTGS